MELDGVQSDKNTCSCCPEQRVDAATDIVRQAFIFLHLAGFMHHDFSQNFTLSVILKLFESIIRILYNSIKTIKNMRRGCLMGSKENKPMLTAAELIYKMKHEKGIRFEYISENEAEIYLADINNYLRTAAYRKNYQKYEHGVDKGKYIDLDFAYLKELSTIDMHLRFLTYKMCIDVEHALKVKLLKDIELDKDADGYDIVQRFLDENKNIIGKLESTIKAPFTGDLLRSYFEVKTVYNDEKGKEENYTIETYLNLPTAKAQ